ncbi:MAG: hypothetical protein KF760_19570 [Candidatus Eremiobacteraeota bacterium]|nr:hypothetical protein [Candidatus Eremiobacteraeota bacterium]MCW5868771.1 hypothetical protein [Candidatus Eremiobacteraeota bacterium]
MRARRRGFLLVLALFMVTFISVLALAFLGSAPLGYRTALSGTFEQQSRWLAQAGIEDARLKLERDPLFPPPEGDEGKFYSYSEEVRELGGGATVGTFDVVIDQSCAEAPYALVRIISTGRLVRQGAEIRKTICAEIDINAKDRRAGHESEDNPNLFRIVNWNEEVEQQ